MERGKHRPLPQATAVATATQEEESERNWAALPADVLFSIARYVLIPDCVRLRAVCSSWNSALKDSLVVPSSHFPWLLFMLPWDNFDVSTWGDLSLVNLLEHRHCRLPFLPRIEINRIRCVGHRDGWLIILRDSLETYLLNPLTGARIPLPSIPSLCREYHPGDSVRKIILSASPSAPCGFIAMAIYNYSSFLAFVRQGDDAWTIHMSAHSDGPATDDIQDGVYHEGKFFTVTVNGQVVAFNLIGHSPKESLIRQGQQVRDLYELEAPKSSLVSQPSSGSLFMINWIEQPILGRTGRNFLIQRFNAAVSPSWVKTNDLGDWSLFLDGWHTMMLSARDVPGLKRNCIYFAPGWVSYDNINCDVEVFDLQKQAYIHPDMRWRKKLLFRSRWFMPSFW